MGAACPIGVVTNLFWVVTFVLVLLSLLVFRLVYLKEVYNLQLRPTKQRVVNDFKNVHENGKFQFHYTWIFFKYIIIKIIFQSAWIGLLKNVQNFSFRCISSQKIQYYPLTNNCRLVLVNLRKCSVRKLSMGHKYFKYYIECKRISEMNSLWWNLSICCTSCHITGLPIIPV